MKEDQSVVLQCSTDRPSLVTWKKVNSFFSVMFYETCTMVALNVEVLRAIVCQTDYLIKYVHKI